MLKKIDIKYSLLFCSLIIAALLAIRFNVLILTSMESFLVSEWTRIIAGIVSFAATISVRIKYKGLTMKESMSFSQFKIPSEEIWSFVSNPISLVCSLSLAKGLFLQFRNKQVVFVSFSTLELTFIGLVVAYLLFDSTMDLVKNLKKLFSKSNSIVAVPEPIPDNL